MRVDMLHHVCASVYCTTTDLPSLISESAKFICDYQWVWDIQMTKFFQQRHWENIPTEVLSYIFENGNCTFFFSLQWLRPLLELTTDELNQLPFGLTKVTISLMFDITVDPL